MMKYIFFLLCISVSLPSGLKAQPSAGIRLKWVDSSPGKQPAGVSWGMPWARGTVKKDQAFTLTGANGKTIPLQSWVTAYWPDGSVKWSGFAAVAAPGDSVLEISAAGTKQTQASITSAQGEL